MIRLLPPDLTIARCRTFGLRPVYLFLTLLLLALPGWGASFTASLDRDTITLGESATLSLAFAGTSQQGPPALPGIPNLQIAYVGPSTQMSFNNGRMSASVTHTYRIMPRAPGDYVIPAITVALDGDNFSSKPLTLKVVKPDAPAPDSVTSGSQPVFIKLALPKKELYEGENILAQVDLYIRNGIRLGQVQPTGFPAEGLLVGKMSEIEGGRRQAQIGNAVFTIIPIAVPLRALKPGALTLGPVTFTSVIEVPSPNRRRDPFFEQFGIRDPFDSGGEQKQMALASEAINLAVLPLPRDNAPPTFNGAVGVYTMNLSVGPTNVATGDPITVRIQIGGQGAIDTLNLPDQPAWKDFKTYPPTTKVDLADAFGLRGAKTFEQIVVPENAEIKALPEVAFSYFDPTQKAYRTLTHPAVPLVVRPGASLPAPVIAATAARNNPETPPPQQDIVPIKQRLGQLASAGHPLLQQPWFLAVQSLPVLAWIASLVWRRRLDTLANNPRLRRTRQVEQILRSGLHELRQFAAQNQSDAFFATLFRLLQEQLGERLDLPASAITEAVVEERLRPRGVPETTLAPVLDLFQTCNLARYAPSKSSQELTAILPRLEDTLHRLRGLKL